MKMKDAIDGYLMDITASGYSPGTIRLYRNYLHRLASYPNNPELDQVSPGDLMWIGLLCAESE